MRFPDRLARLGLALGQRALLGRWAGGPRPRAVAWPRPAQFPWGTALGLALASVFVLAVSLGWRQVQARERSFAVARALTRGDPVRAPALITRYGCGGCHTIPGAPGADGRVAGPLNEMRARVYVGGVARNNADNLIRWIVAPQSLSPRSAMPATGINEAEARDVAAYLYAH